MECLMDIKNRVSSIHMLEMFCFFFYQAIGAKILNQLCDSMSIYLLFYKYLLPRILFFEAGTL